MQCLYLCTTNFNSIEKQPTMATSQVYFSALSQSATSRSLASYSALKKGCFTGFSPLYAPPRRHFVVYVFECTVKEQDGHPDVSAKIYYLDSMHSGGRPACVKQEQEFPGYVYLPPHCIFVHSQFLRLLALVYRSTPKNVKLQQFSPSVPQQPNGHDCCLYALEFAHVLRSEPETTLHLLESGSFPTFSVRCMLQA
jgi:hypothetical protein